MTVKNCSVAITRCFSAYSANSFVHLCQITIFILKWPNGILPVSFWSIKYMKKLFSGLHVLLREWFSPFYDVVRTLILFVRFCGETEFFASFSLKTLKMNFSKPQRRIKSLNLPVEHNKCSLIKWKLFVSYEWIVSTVKRFLFVFKARR